MNEDEGPTERCGHTLTVHGKQLDHLNAMTKRNNDSNDQKSLLGTQHGKLLVSFGESSLLASREYLDDMYLLDLSTLRWCKILGKNILPQYKPYLKANFNPVSFLSHFEINIIFIFVRNRKKKKQNT